MGTNTIEFRTLSYLTRDPIYDMKATHVFNVLSQRSKGDNYMAAVWWDPDSAQPTNRLQTLGAYGDSYFEYMVKQYLLTGRTEPHHKEIATTMLDHVRARFTRRTKSGLTWLSDSANGAVVEHLLCFTGGMYALAAWGLDGLEEEKKRGYLELADGLGEMCYQMYVRQPSGISPDSVRMQNAGDAEFVTQDSKYILRPETVESLFYLYRVTGDEKYRRMSYRIFEAVRKHCKTASGGYTGLRDVARPDSHDDNQQTFFLAETLKYLYLTFAEESKLPLNEWVFNTEGHPVRIRARDPLDVWRAWEDENNGEVRWHAPSIDGVVPVETDRMRAARGGRHITAEPDPKGFRAR